MNHLHSIGSSRDVWAVLACDADLCHGGSNIIILYVLLGGCGVRFCGFAL